MDTAGNKILLAVDGSAQSLDAVRYAGDAVAFANTKVTLFHVQHKITDAFWEVGIDKAFSERMANIAAWEAQQEKMVQEFMNASRQILLDAGFTSQDVEINVHLCRVGVARDIIKEATTRGYGAVVVGREGLSKVKDVVLGSIAYKLIEKLHHTPIWVIGGSPEPRKVLVAIDASEGAMKAVDHVGAVLGKGDAEVQLLHVIRELHPYSWLYKEQNADVLKLEGRRDDKWWEDICAHMNSVLEEAKGRLIAAGFDRKRVNTQFFTGVSSRAGAIMDQATAGDYGTIVVGRRGVSKVKEFLMGRVSNKVLHMARDRAVWIVD